MDVALASCEQPAFEATVRPVGGPGGQYVEIGCGFRRGSTRPVLNLEVAGGWGLANGRGKCCATWREGPCQQSVWEARTKTSLWFLPYCDI